jgi:hypothetical protein
MTHTINNDNIAVATEYTLQPMSTCPIGVDVLLENPGGVLVRGRWDGRNKNWRSWFPFPKRRKDETDAGEKEEEIVHKEWL